MYFVSESSRSGCKRWRGKAWRNRVLRVPCCVGGNFRCGPAAKISEAWLLGMASSLETLRLTPDIWSRASAVSVRARVPVRGLDASLDDVSWAVRAGVPVRMLDAPCDEISCAPAWAWPATSPAAATPAFDIDIDKVDLTRDKPPNSLIWYVSYSYAAESEVVSLNASSELSSLMCLPAPLEPMDACTEQQDVVGLANDMQHSCLRPSTAHSTPHHTTPARVSDAGSSLQAGDSEGQSASPPPPCLREWGTLSQREAHGPDDSDCHSGEEPPHYRPSSGHPRGRPCTKISKKYPNNFQNKFQKKCKKNSKKDTPATCMWAWDKRARASMSMSVRASQLGPTSSGTEATKMPCSWRSSCRGAGIMC